MFAFLLSILLTVPSGFTTLEECIAQGNTPQFILQELNSRQFVVSLKNGVVVNEGGIITQEGQIFKDTETYKEDQHRLLGRKDLGNCTFFNGRLAVISSPGQENWYHWLFQVLPRIKILLDSGVAYDKIYINNLRFSWQHESLNAILALYNISKDCLLVVSGDSVIQASTLIVPSVPFIPSKSPHFPRWLKQFIHSAFLTKTNRSTFPERIYISRSKASIRRISNEDELMNFLKQKGFVSLHLEDLSVYEQANLFFHAKVIIGPHGSGFANLIFSKPGTDVIEIDHGLAGDDQRSFYKRMAQIVDCHYHGYYADLVEENELERDIKINMVDFANFYNKLRDARGIARSASGSNPTRL